MNATFQTQADAEIAADRAYAQWQATEMHADAAERAAAAGDLHAATDCAADAMRACTAAQVAADDAERIASNVTNPAHRGTAWWTAMRNADAHASDALDARDRAKVAAGLIA